MPSGRLGQFVPALACVLIVGCAVDSLDFVGKECTSRCPGALVCVAGRCGAAAEDSALDGGAADGALDGADGALAESFDHSISGISAATHFTCAWSRAGRAKCWGRNDAGQLGIGDTNDRGSSPNQMGDKLPFVDLGEGRTITAIAAAGSHACALLDGGRVKCWGSNTNGKLGLGDATNHGDEPNEMGDRLPFVDLGEQSVVTALTAASEHTCALLEGGRVKCWGMGGRLGLADLKGRGDKPGDMGDALPFVDLGAGRTAKAISAGFNHTCALLDNGRVKCWGANQAGQLGRGDTDGHDETGDALPYVDLGNGRTVTSIASAAEYTCAILDGETMKCWGANNYGQLGLGDTNARGDQPGEMGDLLPVVDVGGRHAAKSVAGYAHTCVLLDFDLPRCWGYNIGGQLGVGDIDNRGASPGATGEAIPVVELGKGRTAKAITNGGWHTCAVLDIDRVKCWGQSFYGQLGLSDTSNRGDNPGEMGDALPYVELGN